MSAPILDACDHVAARDWREAVVAAADVLIQLGAAEPRYRQGCVRAVEEYGPYIVLSPGLALVHARPEAGGLRLAVAAVRLEYEVDFGHPHNDPVDLLLAFSTPDRNAHVGLVSTLAAALSGGLAGELRNAADRDEMSAVLTTSVKESVSDA